MVFFVFNRIFSVSIHAGEEIAPETAGYSTCTIRVDRKEFAYPVHGASAGCLWCAVSCYACVTVALQSA